MSQPQPPTKTHEQLHYESMISYLKWAIGIAGGLIAVIAAVAIFVTFSDRNAMREEYTNAIKELKTQIADIKNDAKDKTQSIRDDAKDAVRTTQEQAGKEISGITLSTHDAAIRETEKQISLIFETNKIQDLIETKAISEIQQKLTPLLEKQTKSITSISDAAAGMRAGQFRAMQKLEDFFMHPKNSFDSLTAKNVYDEICRSFEDQVHDKMKYLQQLSFSITDNHLPTVPRQQNELKGVIDVINDPATDLSTIADVIVLLSMATHQDFKPFEIDRINSWYSTLKR